VGLTKPGVYAIFSLFFAGTAAFLIFGFFKRIPVARVIAIVFHVMYQGVLLWSLLSMCNTEFLKQTIKGITPGMIVFAKSLFVVIAGVVTVINVLAIRYLVKNKDYFSKAGDKVN
jgi:hypothetical protein